MLEINKYIIVTSYIKIQASLWYFGFERLKEGVIDTSVFSDLSSSNFTSSNFNSSITSGLMIQTDRSDPLHFSIES